MDGAGGVGDGAGSVSALLDGLVNGHLQIAHVVERIENTDDVDAVFHGMLHELAHHIIGIVLVAQNVLAAQEHLELGIGHLGADLAQTLPRIFLQIAQAYVKGSTAPHFSRIKTGLIHGLQNGLELAVGQAGSDERLVCIAQNRLSQMHFSHGQTSMY